MNLTRAIIHEILKQPKVIGANSFLSESLLQVNQNTIRLAQNLNNTFSKDDNSYGNFRVSDNLFYDDFLLHQSSLNDESFLDFTRNAISQLTDSIRNILFAKGGFFVFCEYDFNTIRFIGVYLVRDVEGVLFNKDDVNRTFQINQVRYLDTNKLAMGARINIEKLTNNDHNHVTLIRNGLADISEYFVDWIGISQPESNVDFTNKLFQIVSSIERPINPETGQQYDLNEFREVTYNLIKSSPNRVVNLRDLSNSFFGDDNRLIDYAESNGYELDHEFRYDGRALNKFKRINANRDGIRLSFARGDLNQKVSLSEQDDELVTIRSKSLADSIRQQINLQ